MLATVDAAIGQNLRDLREVGGVTQADVAARMVVLGNDWSGANISLLEHGKRKFTLAHLADLCEVLGVPVTAFLGIPDGCTDTVARRLRALGGSETSTRSAVPDVTADEDAQQIARQRRAERVLDRIARGFSWNDQLHDDAEARREAVRAALDVFYPDQDVLDIRERLARERAMDARDAERYRREQAGAPIPPYLEQPPNVQEVADARGWATRTMMQTIDEELQESGLLMEIPF